MKTITYLDLKRKDVVDVDSGKNLGKVADLVLLERNLATTKIVVPGKKNGFLACERLEIPIENVTSAQRRDAKAVNFGIIYGISAFGLSKDLDITPKKAQVLLMRTVIKSPTHFIWEYIRAACRHCPKQWKIDL